MSPILCPRCNAHVLEEETHCGQCGQPRPDIGEPPEAWLGRTIAGKYTITSILGVGGMGMVFEAERGLVGDKVALKVLFPRFLSSELQRGLFRDEAIASARLSHPNVVTVFDAELSDEMGFIAMELLEGRTFRLVLRDEAPLEPARLIDMGLSICEGLNAAHQARIVHRDLKPDNIYLEQRPDGSERIKLVDFGVAAMLDAEEADRAKPLLGTLRYMAPEQCVGEPVDGRTDLYALGVILYEAATRRRATGRTLEEIICDEVVPIEAALPEGRSLPLSLSALIMDMVAKAPHERPADAEEVIARLKQARAELDGETQVMTLIPPMVHGLRPASPPSRLTPTLLGLGAALCLMAALAWGLWGG
ncbi:serine/threonine protein kinase [Myxococcota bacterium]|nr:serine/threonine protein kinase [Myxococcota bacterium]MBU1429777.1 serine/threonine protein kinase [Myxococcota bacterium]MBU1897602.1 serine/threonine protein kinase [Myxococcota bacterium]